MKATKLRAFLVGVVFGHLFGGSVKAFAYYKAPEFIIGIVLAMEFIVFVIASHIWVVGMPKEKMGSVSEYIGSRFHDTRGNFTRGFFLVLGLLPSLIIVNTVLVAVNT